MKKAEYGLTGDFIFKEAVEFLKKKIPLKLGEYREISDECKGKAFTVSGYTSLEVLQKFLDELTEACEQGKTKKDFMDTMNDFLERNGYEGLNPFNADVIFRTTLVFETMKKGFTEKCYDGKPFFATDHPSGEGGKTPTSNMSHLKLSTDSYEAARTAIMSVTGDKGKSLNLVPDLLVVAPANEKMARLILKADQIEGTTNVYKDTAELLVATELADKPDAWFLLCTNKFLKPFIFQKRKPVELTALTRNNDENVFMRDEFVWGADGRSNAGYGFWQMAYGSDGTARG